MHPRSIAIACLAAILAAAGCTHEERPSVPHQNNPIEVGGLYTSQDEDGSWRVTKVLVLDEHAVHLRSYANKFKEMPKAGDLHSLTLGSITDPAGFGIGHYPLAIEGFFIDNPVLIKIEPVRDDELEGYKMYLEAMEGP